VKALLQKTRAVIIKDNLKVKKVSWRKRNFKKFFGQLKVEEIWVFGKAVSKFFGGDFFLGIIWNLWGGERGSNPGKTSSNFGGVFFKRGGGKPGDLLKGALF